MNKELARVSLQHVESIWPEARRAWDESSFGPISAATFFDDGNLVADTVWGEPIVWDPDGGEWEWL